MIKAIVNEQIDNFHNSYETFKQYVLNNYKKFTEEEFLYGDEILEAFNGLDEKQLYEAATVKS